MKIGCDVVAGLRRCSTPTLGDWVGARDLLLST